MVRLNFETRDKDCSAFVSYLNYINLRYGFDVKCYSNYQGVGYRYLYTIKIDDNKNSCSFTIGFQLNYKTENINKGFIEFNPNKCFQLLAFEDFMQYLKQNIILSFNLVRYDCAIDIPVKRKFVKMVRNNRCNYEYLAQDKEGMQLNRSVTEYQGVRNKNKFTKLYDKTKESNLDYDLTRIEYTFKRDETAFKNLPTFLYLPNEQISLFKKDYGLANNDIVLVELLLTSNDLNYYMKHLSSRKRIKIEPYLLDKTLKIDFDIVNQIRKLALSFEL